MKGQVIYGRFEYTLLESDTSESIFEEFRDFHREDENGMIVEGFTVAILNDIIRKGIILTFDREADVFVKLKLAGKKDIKYLDVYRRDFAYYRSLGYKV